MRQVDKAVAVDRDRLRSGILPAADESDVLREQLEYLILHGFERCGGCIECGRLREVRHILLERFRGGERATE